METYEVQGSRVKYTGVVSTSSPAIKRQPSWTYNTEHHGMLTTLDSTVLRAEINVTNWTDLEVPWYLINKMKNNGQFGIVSVMRYYSVQGLFGPFSFLASHLNGILGVIVVAIGRISPNAGTG